MTTTDLDDPLKARTLHRPGCAGYGYTIPDDGACACVATSCTAVRVIESRPALRVVKAPRITAKSPATDLRRMGLLPFAIWYYDTRSWLDIPTVWATDGGKAIRLTATMRDRGATFLDRHDRKASRVTRDLRVVWSAAGGGAGMSTGLLHAVCLTGASKRLDGVLVETDPSDLPCPRCDRYGEHADDCAATTAQRGQAVVAAVARMTAAAAGQPMTADDWRRLTQLAVHDAALAAKCAFRAVAAAEGRCVP